MDTWWRLVRVVQIVRVEVRRLRVVPQHVDRVVQPLLHAGALHQTNTTFSALFTDNPETTETHQQFQIHLYLLMCSSIPLFFLQTV